MGRRSPLVTLGVTGAGLVALLVVNTTLAGRSTYTGGVPTPAAATTPSTPTPTVTRTTRATPAREVVAVFAGHLPGRAGSLAIAVKGGRSVAYFCDGRKVESWLTGTETAGRLALRSKTGDRLAGTTAATSATGIVTVQGRREPFTISKVGPPAGLYRAKTAGATIGWIVLPNGKQVGIDNDGTPAPAPPLNPQTGTATVAGTTVTAKPITGAETF